MEQYKVKYGQTIFDVALQLYGDISGIGDLLANNPKLNLGSVLAIGDILNWDSTKIVNQTVTTYFTRNNIFVSNGEANVYYKETSEEVKSIIMIDKSRMYLSWVLSGSGTLFVDWGDNTPIQTIELSSAKQTIIHNMDSKISVSHDYRKIKLMGEFSLDALLIGESDVMRMFAVDAFNVSEINISGNRDMTNIGFFNVAENAVIVSMSNIKAGTLLPLISQELMRDLWINDAGISQKTLDEYFIGLVKNYQDRPPCNVRVWGNSSPSGVYRRPVELFNPMSGLEAMWVLENERGWTIQEIIEPPNKSTLTRRLRSRDGWVLKDDIADRDASICLPVSKFVAADSSRINTGVAARAVNQVEGKFFLGGSGDVVGGRNLVIGSTEPDRLPKYGVTATVSKLPDNNISKYKTVFSNIVRTAGDFVFFIPYGNNPGFFSQSLTDVESMISFFIRTNSPQEIFTERMPSVKIGIDSNWKRVTFPYTHNGSGNLHFLLSGADLQLMEIHSFQIEKGNKATDWTPAPEDNILVGTLFGARDSITGASMGCDLLEGGWLRFRHGAAFAYSDPSLFDLKVHTIGMDNSGSGGALCVIDGREIARLPSQSADISTPISFGCYGQNDGSATGFVDALIWDIILNRGEYITPLPHLGYDTAVGVKHVTNNVYQHTLCPTVQSVENSGGSEYMQKYGAVARRTNLVTNGFSEKIGDGSLEQAWSSGAIGAEGDLIGKRLQMSATMKINQAAKDALSSVSVSCVFYNDVAAEIGRESVTADDITYGIYRSFFIVPALTDHVELMMTYNAATGVDGRVYAKEISLTNTIPEFIPNKITGENLFPLLSGDSLISGSDFLNETAFKINFAYGVESSAETMWNKSNTDVWQDSIRLSVNYDPALPCEWDMTELNQQYIVDNINTDYLYYLWAKVDAGVYRDIFQYNAPLTGDDRDRCNRYVHLYT